MTGVEQGEAPHGPTERRARPADAESEVAWSSFINVSGCSKSIDDALDGRGHCRELAFGGLIEFRDRLCAISLIEAR